MKVAKKVDLKNPHHKKKIFVTVCGDKCYLNLLRWSQIYTNIESLCCTPSTNIMLYVNYISFPWAKDFISNQVIVQLLK